MSDPLRSASTAPFSHLLTDAEIDAVEARANAATPGPWEATCERMVETVWTDSDDERLDVCEVLHYGAKGHAGGTAAFIAHARTDAPALARTARAERRRAEEAERERDDARAASAVAVDAARRMEAHAGEMVAERNAAKAIVDAWAEYHATEKACDAAGDALDRTTTPKKGARATWDAACQAHATAAAKLEALGVSL